MEINDRFLRPLPNLGFKPQASCPASLTVSRTGSKVRIDGRLNTSESLKTRGCKPTNGKRPPAIWRWSVVRCLERVPIRASLTWIIKLPFLLLALGLWILACPASLAEDDDPNALNQRLHQLFEQGKYQEAIPIAERAVEVAKRVRGPDTPRPPLR